MSETQPQTSGYLATPAGGSGPGVLVLHAWWGLNDFFRALCDRLAGEGFVAYAPDLYGGKVAASIEEAERLLDSADGAAMRAAAVGGVDLLRGQPGVAGGPLGAIGFSMGGGWALELSALRPDDIAAVVLFYGCGEADFTKAKAAYLGHFVADDPWEPEEYVRQMEAAMRAAGREVTLHTYSGAGHWFFEANRPDDYNATAAEVAWERTLAFLRAKLEGR